MDSTKERTWVGVDVSKEHWDVAINGSSEVNRYASDETGTQALINDLSILKCVQVCLEATGSYHQPLVKALHETGIAVSIINPANVRSFARARGQLAKTDRIDALQLVQFGLMMKPEPSEMPSENQGKLRALRTRRQQLVDAQTQEKNRLGVTNDPAARASIEAALEFYDQQLKSIEEQINQLLQKDPQFQRWFELLVTVPGIRETTAAALIAELPELGSMNRRQTARLAGLAPINRDSGAMRGKRTIAGGRARVRKALYMPTLVATRHNPAIRDFYQQLLARGKNKMAALTACMRKLLLTLNAMIKENQAWENRKEA